MEIPKLLKDADPSLGPGIKFGSGAMCVWDVILVLWEGGWRWGGRAAENPVYNFKKYLKSLYQILYFLVFFVPIPKEG